MRYSALLSGSDPQKEKYDNAGWACSDPFRAFLTCCEAGLSAMTSLPNNLCTMLTHPSKDNALHAGLGLVTAAGTGFALVGLFTAMGLSMGMAAIPAVLTVLAATALYGYRGDVSDFWDLTWPKKISKMYSVLLGLAEGTVSTGSCFALFMALGLPAMAAIGPALALGLISAYLNYYLVQQQTEDLAKKVFGGDKSAASCWTTIKRFFFLIFNLTGLPAVLAGLWANFRGKFLDAENDKSLPWKLASCVLYLLSTFSTGIVFAAVCTSELLLLTSQAMGNIWFMIPMIAFPCADWFGISALLHVDNMELVQQIKKDGITSSLRSAVYGDYEQCEDAGVINRWVRPVVATLAALAIGGFYCYMMYGFFASTVQSTVISLFGAQLKTAAWLPVLGNVLSGVSMVMSFNSFPLQLMKMVRNVILPKPANKDADASQPAQKGSLQWYQYVALVCNAVSQGLLLLQPHLFPLAISLLVISQAIVMAMRSYAMNEKGLSQAKVCAPAA